MDSALKAGTEKLREELRAIRGSRPSVDLVAELKVSVYDETMTVNQLGSLSVLPPRGIQITVWDKNAVGAVMKAIEGAKIGLSVTNDGQNIIATLSQLGDERREELGKLVKKTAEGHKIQVRARRDEAIKKIKEGEGSKQITEDEAFKSKEKIQRQVDETNERIEAAVEGKLKELSE